MARFQEALNNLRGIAENLPTSISAKTASDGGPSAFEQRLIEVLQKEDYTAVRIALLIDKLISKYKGRAV